MTLTAEQRRDTAGRGQLIFGRTGSKIYIVAGVCALELQVILDHISDVPLHLAVCLDRTQRSSSFIVVEPMSRGTVVGVVVQKLKRFMSEAEAEVRAICV